MKKIAKNSTPIKKKHPTNLIVAGDIHFDCNWDNISKNVEPGYDFLNPNEIFRNFIKEINKNRTALAVIINGDLVDQYFTDYLSFTDFLKNKDENYKKRISNWDPFYKILNKLKKPYYQNLGNHEYRKEPYNYGLWDRLLDQDLPDTERKKIAPKIGHSSSRWFFEFGDIRVNEDKFNTLQKYTGIRSATEKKIGPYCCIFLNTGMDSFVEGKNLLKYLTLFLAEKFKFSQSSEGLKNEDLIFVENSLKKNKKDNSIYLFMHAPIINSRKSKIGKKYKLSENNYIYKTAVQGVGFETMLNGGGKLLKILQNSNKNIFIIASHVHNSKHYLINKKTLSAKEVSLDELNKMANNKDYIKHSTTHAMGSLSLHEKIKKTGYLIITPKGIKEKITGSYRLFDKIS